MIDLIAVDIDGTLLNANKVLTQETIEALHDANNRGLKIVLCTGRPYLAAKPVLDLLGLKGIDDYLVTFNGGQIHRASDGRVIHKETLSYEDFNLWFKEFQRLKLPFNAIDDQWVYEPETDNSPYPSIYVSQVTSAPAKKIDYHSFNPSNSFLKFVVATDERYLDKQLQKMDENLLKGYELVKSHPFQIEICQCGVSKGQALAFLGDRLNIPMEHMMAIGDQENDRSMIQAVGLGVAMGNASPSLKEVADYVTKDNNDHGVAHAIYNFIK